MGTRVGYGERVGRGRGIPGTHLHRARSPADSEAGPVTPCRGVEWVVSWAGACPGYHPAGPVSQPAGLPVPRTRLHAASQPIRARLTSILVKLSQNHEVSTEYVQKASHSPYSQNGLVKSPLDFLGFPILLAFSHKELMVPF